VLRELVGLTRPVEPGHDLARDLQLDSVALMTLVVELERIYAVELQAEDAQRVRTVADLAALVARRAGERRPRKGRVSPPPSLLVGPPAPARAHATVADALAAAARSAPG
jgi:acyl carrier protein